MDNLMFSILEWCLTIFFLLDYWQLPQYFLKLTWEISATRE